MLYNVPTIGGPAQDGMMVVDIIISKLNKLAYLKGESYLDVGCGNGVFTARLSKGFEKTFGIDIEPERLRDFRQNRTKSNILICLMSVEAIGLPSSHFDVVTAIEVLEHIPELEKAISEIHRVLKPNGILLVTCPNRLFPFETHGIWWRGREIGGRIPLLTYFPSLHSRLALARVFTVGQLDRLMNPIRFERIGLDFAFPTFERGSRWGIVGRPFRKVMRILENSFLRYLGVSIIASYRKI